HTARDLLVAETQEEGQSIGRGAGGEALKAALVDARLGLSEQPPSDAQPWMAHEDAADAGRRSDVAASMPADRADELAVEPSAVHLLSHHQRDIRRRIDEALEGGSLLFGEHVEGLRAQRRDV